MKTSKWKRSTKVLYMAFTIFIKIYWYKFMRKNRAEWDLLWIDIGKRFRKTLFELEGLLIKIGQLLSIRADLLPHSFINQIQDLTDKVPPSEWLEIEEILEKEWGCSVKSHFLHIEKEAVASASIGEVYKGTLVNGQEVAIKVQRPNIQSIIQSDFRTLKIIIWFANHIVPLPKGFINFNVLFQELKEVIERELDFTLEKDTLLAFKERFKNNEHVKIPNVVNNLSTSNVLVMEWVNGSRFVDANVDKKQELAQKLLEVFLPQWLEPGTFHADPHPGNVLVSENGQLILLDFGMVGDISRRDATYFQQLMESLLSKDFSKAVESLTHLGFLLPEADTRTIEKLLAELMSFQTSDLKEIDLIKLKLEMNDLIQALPIQVPTRFIFLGRSFITIEGMIRNLLPEEELMGTLKPVFLDWLNKQGNTKWTFLWYWLRSQPLFKTIYSFTELAKLPKKLEAIKETEQRRQFQFSIYENTKKQLFQLLLVALIGIGIGIYSFHQLIFQLSVGLSSIASIGYIISAWKLKKWLKFMQEKR